MPHSFKPDFKLEGDPQRNQNQFAVLSGSEPFEILQVEYVVEERIQVTQKVETELDVTQRIPLFQDTLRKLRHGSMSAGEWPVEMAVQYRRLGSEATRKYSCVLQACRKPGIFRLVVRKGRGTDPINS